MRAHRLLHAASGVSSIRVRITSPGAAPSAAAAASAFSIAVAVCLYVSPGWRTPSGPIGAVPLTATCEPIRTAREYEARSSNAVPLL